MTVHFFKKDILKEHDSKQTGHGFELVGSKTSQRQYYDGGNIVAGFMILASSIQCIVYTVTF